MPSHHIRSEWFLFPHEDKVIHAILYCIFAALFLFDSKRFYNLTASYILIAVGIICFIGAAIEILQPIVSTRTADFSDFIANSLGAALAGVFFYYYIRVNSNN